MLALVGIAILGGYGVALWWLLRRESAWTFVALACLCGIALGTRLVLTDGYPWGLAEDEPKFLSCSVDALARGSIADESCIHIPYLLTSLYQAPLVPVIGANRWSIRSYAMITSVLAIPALFAAARAMGLRVAPSLFAGGLAAVLPWSIYYGRMILGGELIFHQALLLAGLGRLIWQRGRWPDALLGAFGLCLLLYDYWAGRAMAPLPLAAAVLATGTRRLWCVAVLGLALIGWYPHLATGPRDAHVGLSLQGARGATIAGGFHAGFEASPAEFLQQRGLQALRTLYEPIAQESIFTMRSVAMHPLPLLVVAVVGLLTGVRRGLFLLGGFVAGILPGIVSGTFAVSAHRIMMVYAFIALAAAAPLTLVPWAWPRRLAAAAAFAAVGVWSVPFYFSYAFWPPHMRWTVNSEMTALAEGIADEPPPHAIYMHQLGFYSYLASMPEQAESLTIDNWLPPNDTRLQYAFTWHALPLRPQYERLFPGRVRPAGRESFLVTLEAADWSWLRAHGWTNELRCGDQHWAAIAPFLYHVNLTFRDVRCAEPLQFLWRARWDGPPATMLLRFSGAVTIEAGGPPIAREGFEQEQAFSVPTGAVVEITQTLAPGSAAVAQLFEQTPAGPRVPDWDRFTPVGSAAR